MSNEEFDRLEQLEDIVRIAEEKNEDDNAALAREISKLWDAIYELKEIIDQSLLEKADPQDDLE